MGNRSLAFFLMSGLLDSNQRPRAPQTCALPTALSPEHYSLTPTLLSNAGAKVHRNFEMNKFSTYFFRYSTIFSI